MATNMNLQRKPNLGEYTNMPIAGSTDYNMAMGMNKPQSNFPSMPMGNNPIGTNDPSTANPNINPYNQNHFNQGINNFGAQSRQFQDPMGQKFSANMPARYGTGFDSNSSDYQLQMARMQGKFRPQNVDQTGFPQQRNMGNNPWPPDYGNRNSTRRSMPIKTPIAVQGCVDPTLSQNMPPDQNFSSPGATGSPQQPYQMQSPYMPGGDMFKQSRAGDQQFGVRGMTNNFHPQDFYQQEQMRQIANQYQQTQLPRPPGNYLTPSQRNSPSPFGQPSLPKPSQDALYSQQQFNVSPKSNGPHPGMVNMLDERQVPFPNSNYPVSPVGSQMPSKPGFPPSLGMRGTVSPNVTIGMPKKPMYRPQEEVTSPNSNQNAAAAAAAAAVLAAVNTANPLASPQSDMHNMSRPPSVPNNPSRPPSIPGARSPATSIVSDHKSESGGSGVNDFRTTPSPARSLSRNTPQMASESSAINFSSDVETGRVPSPSVNQLPSSDIEAMIHSVSNIPGGAVAPSDLAQRSKPDTKPEITSKAKQRSGMSPVTPPSPFSLSPSINVDFDIDMLSPSWEDPSSRSATPLSKLYKLSEEPERKEFLDKLVSYVEQQGKTLNEVPKYNGSILDLFKLYQLVSKRGGMHEVTRLRLWKEVIQSLTSATSSNEDDEQTLREHYSRFLLRYEEKLGVTLGPTIPQPPSQPLPQPSQHPTALPANPEPGNIDLSSMTYKTMFQPNNTPSSPFSQGGMTQPSMQPPSYPNTPTTQGYPSTPPMQHLGYRNMPHQPSGYGYPQRSPRVPSYPSGHPNYNPQYPGFSQSQMPSYNGIVPPRYPNYPRNQVPPEALYGQFPRGPGMNKFQQMDPQGMFPNYQQQGGHPSGYMYQQQQSSMAAYQMERQRQRGVGSPRPRMQSPWGQRYPDPGSTSGSQSSFCNSQSPKLQNVRPPPPYPHPKQEKPSPTPQSAAAALQYQAMKAGSKLSPAKKEDDLFPAGCIETTQAHHTKKRRLTARDIGPVEAWRIMMSLKSGLLTETAWALDTLTILLSDDATVGFFRLSHLPGFLDTVVEHFRRNLINVFDVLEESEIDIGVPKRFLYGFKEEDKRTSSETLPNEVATENFASVIVADFLTDVEDPGFDSGFKNWKEGGGDITIHIQTHFETDPLFYEDRKRKQTDRLEDIAEVESDDDREHDLKTLRKEDGKEGSASSGNLNTDHGRDPTTNDQGNIKKPARIRVDVKDLFNGIPSPNANAELNLDLPVKTKPEVLDCGPQQNCCNGKQKVEKDSREDCECEPKLEPAIKEEMDPSALLIKKLKTELDLDLESVVDNSEEIASTSCDMRNVCPTESECELRQEYPLSSVTLSQDSAINSCSCVSNIIRNLSFVPGNDVEMAKHPSLLRILARLLLLHHLERKNESTSQYNDSYCWWQDCLDIVRENTLVTIANIAGYLDLSHLSGSVSQLLLDGLLHWLVCQSSVANEPLRSTSASVCLTPKQLILETLAKMSVLETNVDHILSSPDKERLTKAYEYLVKLFSDKANEVTREFALVLLSSFTQAKVEICSVHSERNLVTVLVGFLEDAQDRVDSMAVRGLHPGMFRDNDLRVSMGMLRRASGLLACIAKRSQSTHLIPFQERILALCMSRALDAEVQSHLSNVLYNLPR